MAQERPRMGKYKNFYDPSAIVRKQISMAFLAARVLAKNPVLPGTLHVYISFYGCGSKCDLDNLIKFCCDAGNGVLWNDDRQIVQIHASMIRIDEVPRTELEIVEV